MEFKTDFKSKGNPFNLIIGLLIILVFALGLFKLTTFMFWLLKVVTPVLVVATLILDYKVFVRYFNWVVKLFKSNAVTGIIAIVATLVAYPAVAAILFGKALFNKSLKDAKKKDKSDFTSFEEMDSTPMKIPDYRKETRNDKEYEDLID